VPKLETHPHRFDIPGVILSAVGMFLLVFGIQEGEKYNWGTIVGPISVWSLIIAGIVVLIGFVVWQRFNKGEPLLPLKLFRDRNFSLANGAITTVGFAVTSMSLPLVFFFQIVLGFTPTQSALMLVPMAVFSGGLAPLTGKLVDIINPRYIACFGLLLFGIALFWYAAWLDPNPDLWPRLLIPSAVLGIAMSSVWSPITTTATYNLPQAQAGAGAGVFNTTRQVGAVLGSAAIAALIQGRLTAELPSGANVSTSGAAQGGALPHFLHAGFTNAMAQTLLLPASVAILGAIIVIFFEKRKKNSAWGTARTAEGARNDAAAAAAADGVAPDAVPVPVGAGIDAVGSASTGGAGDSSGAHGSHAAPVEPDRVPESAVSPDGHSAHGAHAAPAPHGAHAAPVEAD
jgi:Na+/melibiose symporter-like transporter